MPRIVDHDAQRAELLTHSFALFADKGYGGVSMRGLAKALGVSTGTLYHYFDGKPDIFGQMLGFLADRDIAEVVATLEPEDDQGARLRRLLRWVESREDYLRRLLLLSLDAWRLDPDASSRAALMRISRVYRDALAERLDLPDVVGSALFSTLMGMIAHHTLDPEGGAIEPQLQLFARLLPLMR